MELELNKKAWLKIQKEFEHPNDFIVGIINDTIANTKSYSNGYGLYVDYDKIYKNNLFV